MKRDSMALTRSPEKCDIFRHLLLPSALLATQEIALASAFSSVPAARKRALHSQSGWKALTVGLAARTIAGDTFGW
jgi:hypothetical protein